MVLPDGNGRISRFISSLYLSKTLDFIPALSLSRGCNKYKNIYLEAFEHTNSIMNRGELNSFIDSFLDIIYRTLLKMVEELKEKTILMEGAENKIKSDQNVANDKEHTFMFILAQNKFFSNNDGLTVQELTHELGLSIATVRKIAENLIEKAMIKKHGIRPAYYHIDEEYLER